jgi:putative lipoic acid-binding regulatory protein
MGAMEAACRRPEITYPTRVPMKIIGRQEELRPDMVLELILAHLGPQPEGDLQYSNNCKGAFISYTFWVTLPNATVETPLREAIQRLPGVVMQL